MLACLRTTQLDDYYVIDDVKIWFAMNDFIFRAQSGNTDLCCSHSKSDQTRN